MSTPICSRCQKIYVNGKAPVKCVNCGGDIRLLEADKTPKASVTKSDRESIPRGNTVNRSCSRPECNALSAHSIKYYYTGKRIVMAPAPSMKDRDAQDLCQTHASAFIAPNTWNLEYAQFFPSILDNPSSGVVSREKDGLATFFTFIFGIIVLAFIAFVGGFIILQIINFFSGIDMDDSTRPFRIPFRGRR